MLKLIETNYMSAECMELRDTVNEIIKILDTFPKPKGDPQEAQSDSIRTLKNGRILVNGRMISNAKAREMGLK